ncbi:Gfo/Idh/MocA family protein [Methyloraptor flagellatus]|jgi:D-galactose 1-dehydrogenase|uniref:Gfo/Idh/MocA family oxidoreductase n=1 Tax=Methyloraptor flagellatus TaxID=3162530 RepID=A0AAU7X8T9_9HYPH
MKVALVGIGKIARDQHVPAIADSGDWELAATVSRSGSVTGVAAFHDYDAMLAERTDIPVVSLCLPPQPRFDYALKAIRAGRHVMLEKPPGQTLAEVHTLAAEAEKAGVTLFATWHSRMAHGVAPAKAWLADKTITKVTVTWKEDVRRWHPGQDWVFEPGGMGVFDPGINALSIVTEILPMPIRLTAAVLEFPANRHTPIAANLTFSDGVSAVFDWRQEGPQTWDITVETTAGRLDLHDGGARLVIDGAPAAAGPDREYAGLYARMAELVKAGASDVDATPLVHVADAFMLGSRRTVLPFEF